MELNGFWTVFAVGCGGGIVAEALRWFKIRENPEFPVYLRSAKYWIITVIMILIGGGLAPLYGTKGVNALLALNIGASAPLIITALVGTTPANAIPKPVAPTAPAPPVTTMAAGVEPVIRAEAALPTMARQPIASMKNFISAR